jgi:sulfide:quinone oxidoreductase
MKKILILGSGAGGTMCAAKLRRELGRDWKITIIDNDEMHHYQPGWLFIPFGIYTAADCQKPKRDFIPQGVDFILDDIVGVNPEARTVECKKAKYDYDWLIIATGCQMVPNEIDGLENWKADGDANEHSFFTLESAVALHKRMKHFEKGKMIFNIAEMPHKCPVVPMEFVFLADWYFREAGVRDNVEIELVTPNTGIFTKPIATKVLSKTAEEKNILVKPNFDLAEVDPVGKRLVSPSGETADYDIMVSTMPNLGAEFIDDSGLGDGMGYLLTDHHTLKSVKYDNIYAVGDASNVPTSKAGSVAHYQAELVTENILREIDGLEPKDSFDGHSTCFIVSGYDKAFLFDFNYKTEPLPGKYPFPAIGPFDLVGESHMNYWGKMMFKWVYWNLLLTGKELPLEPQMSMAGKFWPKFDK